MDEKLIKVCSVTFAASQWHKRRLSVYAAIDAGRLRAWQLQQGRWWISVDDLNALWGNCAPKSNDYLYITSMVVPSNLPQGARQLSR